MSQLQSSLLLACLALIPNNALRYTILGMGAAITVVYIMHMKRPSTLLRQLEDTIQETEGLIRSAKSQCARDQCDLGVEDARLLQIKVGMLEIERCILESEHITWKEYRPLSQRIFECKEGSGRYASLFSSLSWPNVSENIRRRSTRSRPFSPLFVGRATALGTIGSSVIF
ncbi:hypothetical protein B0H10DRAFT_663201 [Mycena sp. CBHHK59/15]|nr:hypothetical protein B0H10DRAFT_663201 [Mycena sp. CBHHK59/15]